MKAVEERSAAIRHVQRLQLAGGLGDKIFSPAHLHERDIDLAWQ